ncbi:MAG: 1-deoxy-D-xylulose-5-phosphate reductoisomerase, partial [Bacteroidales bacterium]|nr:1-deoxy-D-xylulose-5-phosphate reductoisomerase [Bacteroidales bacterium]
MQKRRIAILGSTGSIGTQTLDVIRRHRDLFEVELISARRNTELLEAQAREFDVNNVVICEESLYDKLNDALRDTDSKIWAGIMSLCDLVQSDSVDIVVGAMVGFSGLSPTLAAIKAGKIIALANKETLVAAGGIVTRMVRENGASILPVDSEHSAIFQCLQGAGGNKIEKIHLTASGGPFREWPKEKIAAATAADALKHPNWNMGSKVTIDSATMMNKGFEVIEARWLFDTPV